MQGLVNFAERSEAAELMDTEAVGFDEFRACLEDLARVNRLSLAYRPTLRFMKRLLSRARRLRRPLQIVDVGSGYGDMLRKVDDWGLENGVELSLTGVDLNPWSRRAATEATRPSRRINWITADAFAFEPPNGIDVVISSLFTHHLSDPLIVRFLGWMEANARLGWFINDLHRHPIPYHVFRRVSQLANLHRFVKHDGPISIARAFSTSDWRRLIASAEIQSEEVLVEWMTPFRLTVSRLRAE
jgi:SAM-dependent methyltransferase